MKFISEITVTPIAQMGDDSLICAAAKVSTTGSLSVEDSETPAKYGLINYLMKHRHGTPFEHGALTVFVHAPIFVWREWHRHRIGFSYNEESGRYKTLEPVFYIPPADRPMFKVEDWKPGRPKFLTIEEMQDFAQENDFAEVNYPNDIQKRYSYLRDNLCLSYETAYKAYIRNLDMGFDPGLARDCLPVGIYSSCWVTMNPRSLMAFLSLRTHEESATFVSYPLYEIEQAARKLEDLLKTYWPLTHSAWIANGGVAP